MNRTVLIIGGIIAIIIVMVAVVGFLGVGRVPSPPAAGSVEVWGFGDDENIWQDVINRFQATHQTITVTYRRFDAAGYEDMLINRLAEGKGPDVFFVPHTWVTKHRDKIFPMPQRAGAFSVSDFKSTFVDAAADDMISPAGEILGMPVFMDTLALFYNKDLFNAAGIAEPPAMWDEVATTSRMLTHLGPGGDITASGIALGSARNVEHSFEIMSALMLQKGGISSVAGKASFGAGAGTALAFYTSFADPAKQNFSWSKSASDSLDAFAQGTTAMMIGFAGDIERIRARNPHLNFAIAPLPQVAASRASANWGEYFFPAVSQQSKNKQAAWQFIMFASSREGAVPYLAATHRPPARRDLISAGTNSTDLAVFWPAVLAARSWAVPDDTATRRLFEEAIDAVLSRTADPASAVSRLESQLRLLTP